MQARWGLSIAIAVHLACTGTGSRRDTGSRPATSSIRPMKLRYHGEHRGDHPAWLYTAHVTVNAESYGGRAVWRRSYRFETIDPPAGWSYNTIEGTIVLDRDSLAPLEARSTFGKARHQSMFRSDGIEGTSV